MEPDAAREVIGSVLGEIAPEIDLDELDASVPFAAEADLDSMDLLSLAEMIHERTGVDIADGDLPSPWSLDQLIAELARRAAG